MIGFLVTFLTALAFGLGIGLLLFGGIFCYQVFSGEKEWHNPLVMMGISFGSIVFGLTLLFLIFLKFT